MLSIFMAQASWADFDFDPVAIPADKPTYGKDMNYCKGLAGSTVKDKTGSRVARNVAGGALLGAAAGIAGGLLGISGGSGKTTKRIGNSIGKGAGTGLIVGGVKSALEEGNDDKAWKLVFEDCMKRKGYSRVTYN